MPQYCFVCPMCRKKKEVTRPMKDSGLPEKCVCGIPMERNFIAEHNSVRGDYDEPIVSTSLAFNTQDLDEHRRRHPGVELKIDIAGHTAYPVFRNLSQKRKYLKARGWVDCNSYT